MTGINEWEEASPEKGCLSTIVGAMGYKEVETATGRVGQFINLGQIITSDHPGDKAYAIGTGMAIGGIAGNGVGMAFSLAAYSGPAMIPVIVIGGIVIISGGYITSSVDTALGKWRASQDNDSKIINYNEAENKGDK